MSRPGPLALLRMQRLRTAAVVTSLFMALALAIGTGSSPQQELPTTVDSSSVVVSAAADEPAQDRGAGDGHDIGVLCLAITCLLVVLALVLPSIRRWDGYLGLAARNVRAVLAVPAALNEHPPRLEVPTRC